MTLGGFVIVQDHVHIRRGYLGIARYAAWPLNLFFKDEKAQALSHEVFLQSINAHLPFTLPFAKIDLLISYLQYCNKIGLFTKLFYLGMLGNPPVDAYSIGWDYIASLDLSYIYDDGLFLFSEFPRELSAVRDHMTSSGLFGARQDAEQYAAIRRKLDCERLGLEYNGEEFFVETFLVSLKSF